MKKLVHILFWLGLFLRAETTVPTATLLDSALTYKQTNPKKALDFVYKFLETENDIPDTTIAAAELIIGTILNQQGLPIQALDYYVRSLEKYLKIDGYSSKVGWHLIEMGNVYFHQGLYDEAAEKYRIALEKFRKINILFAQATALNNLGLICIEKGDYDGALSYFTQALELRKIYQEEPYLILHSYKLLGDLYSLQGQEEQAMKYYKKIVRMKIPVGEGNIKGLSYESIGDILVKLNNHSLAITTYKSAEEDFIQDLNPKYLTGLYIKIADVYQSTQSDSSMIYLNKALNAAEKYGLIGWSITVLEKLISKYDDVGDSEKTILYFRKLDELRRNRFDTESNKSIRTIETHLELSAHQQKLKEKETRIISVVQMRNTAIVIIVVLIILLWSFYRYYRYKKNSAVVLMKQKEELHLKELEIEQMKAQQTENEFEVKKQELISKIIFLQKRGAVSEIKKDLNKDVEHIKKKKDLTEFESAISALDEMETAYTDWRKFEEQCLTNYPELYEKLSAKYPSLTIMDKRICTFVLLKIESKDMAIILGKTVRAIENLRYRLRKKMNVPAMNDLYEVLYNLVEEPKS